MRPREAARISTSWSLMRLAVVTKRNGNTEWIVAAAPPASIRVPTINVSLVDLSFIAARDTTAEEVNAIMKSAADTGPLAGILNYSTGPLVSVDFNHDPSSSTFDATLTKVSGRLVKVSSWYDNEWGFSNRMLDVTMALMAAK